MLPRLALNSWAQVILLPQPPKSWNYRYVPPCPASKDANVYENCLLEMVLFTVHFPMLVTDSCFPGQVVKA
jgi:hypothetical protein